MRAIAREVGEDWRAFHRHCELRNLLADEPVSLTKRVKYESLFQKLFGRLLDGGLAVMHKELATEWIRLWRWCGMLALASRSYKEAKRGFSKAFASCTDYADLTENEPYPLKGMLQLEDAELAHKILPSH